jgi:hypothetical protein
VEALACKEGMELATKWLIVERTSHSCSCLVDLIPAGQVLYLLIECWIKGYADIAMDAEEDNGLQVD